MPFTVFGADDELNKGSKPGSPWRPATSPEAGAGFGGNDFFGQDAPDDDGRVNAYDRDAGYTPFGSNSDEGSVFGGSDVGDSITDKDTGGSGSDLPPGYGDFGSIGWGGPGEMDWNSIFGPGSSYFNYAKPALESESTLPPDDQGANDLIINELKKVIGGQTRYSPEVMESIKSGLKTANQATLANTLQGVDEDAISRGLYRSGVAGRNAAAARMASSADYTGQVQKVLQKKAETDFEDKMLALNRTQDWLQQLRSYALSADMASLERDKLKADIALAWQRLDQERQDTIARLKAQDYFTKLGMMPIEGRDYLWTEGDNGVRRRVPLTWLGATQTGPMG